MQPSPKTIGARRRSAETVVKYPTAPPPDLLDWSLDCCADALAVLDKRLRFVAVNQAWRERFGLRGEVAGRTAEAILEALGVADAARAFLDQPESATGGREIEVEGDQVWLRAWAAGADGVGGVTVRHRSSRSADPPQSFDRSAPRLRLAMDMAKVVAFEFDFRTGVGTFDPPDIGLDKVRVRRFEDLFNILPADFHQAALVEWERHLGTGELYVLEYRWPLPNGEVGWHMNACEAIRDDSGEVIGLIGMRQDITDRKRAELAIMAEREAAMAADKAKSEFLANMSHEIRTPLNGVLAMAQVMARDELEASQREKLDIIRQSGEDLLHIINDILDFSKIEAGKLELETIPFDPSKVLDNVLASFAAVAERKTLALRLEIDDAAKARRMGDPARLRQIVSNYVSNALKFTAEGEVCISVRGAGAQGRDGLTVAVRDSGAGISQEKMPLLFQKFSQVDASTTRQFGGTGLGLAICRELAGLMGGRVWADSEVGVGSTFYVTLALPHAAEIGPSQPAEAEADGLASQGLRILAAEDNPTNQVVLATIMKVMGFDLSMVSNGREAVEAWRSGAFDVILMDVQMPEMDGVEATRLIRAAEASGGLRRTPIIILSANAFKHQVNEYLAAGADAHVAKPIELTALYAALEVAAGGVDVDRDDEAAAAC